MYSEVAWVLVSSGTQVQSQIILVPDYLSAFCDYAEMKLFKTAVLKSESAIALVMI